MKLLKVRLQGFGQFNEGLDVALNPDGLTVVVGRNEAGKSTLLNAVVGVLFGFRDYNMVRKYEPWDTHEAYGGEVEVAAEDGRRLRISRDFKSNHATILELKDGDELPAGRRQTVGEGTGLEPLSVRPMDVLDIMARGRQTRAALPGNLATLVGRVIERQHPRLGHSPTPLVARSSTFSKRSSARRRACTAASREMPRCSASSSMVQPAPIFSMMT